MKDEALNKIIDSQKDADEAFTSLLEDYYKDTFEVLTWDVLREMRKNLKKIKKQWLYKPTDTDEKIRIVNNIYKNFSKDIFEQFRTDWIYDKWKKKEGSYEL